MILHLDTDLVIKDVNKIVGYCINSKISKSVKKKLAFVVLRDEYNYNAIEMLKNALIQAVFARLVSKNLSHNEHYNKAINTLINKVISVHNTYCCDDVAYQRSMKKYNIAIKKANEKIKKLLDYFMNHRGIICKYGMSEDELKNVCEDIGLNIADLELILNNGPHDVLKMMFGIALKKSIILHNFFDNCIDAQNVNSYIKIIDYVIFHEKKEICKLSDKIVWDRLLYTCVAMLQSIMLVCGAICIVCNNNKSTQWTAALFTGLTFAFMGLQCYVFSLVLKDNHAYQDKLHNFIAGLQDILSDVDISYYDTNSIEEHRHSNSGLKF
ncbi:hypothetical protein [Candidatus Neoehrlichia procyonis]|uniref:Uncharacterized protein n=1 Tax=Candidatus Neoehrlichia procyonis str. RAC413 TaxID=1359163 RepID=A0A0F3NMV9_9RICK|nr:hypothetical protein [Candidatus Neoehrlichia lotoris]KJV69086.1 hypothetical protein NLO413_0462 [Candidatus Neoehrlichia lotoris str. RAC413]